MNDRQFDKTAAQEWIETIEGEGSRVRDADLYPYLRKWTELISPRNVLDIGCGQGVCSSKIDLTQCRYVGVDPSKFLLERAKELYPNPSSQFVVGNAYSLPFDGERFDAAFSIAVWHLLENKERAASELSRVLRNDGHFLIVAANPVAYEAWTRTYSSSKRNGVRFEGTNRLADGTESTDVLFLHTLEEIVASLQSASLIVQETTTFRTAIALSGRKSA